jgi:NDP-sugar pyrophosphorylase family protein
MTKKTDLINIGVYIIDPSEDILKETKKMTWHKEDVFFDKLIQKKLLAAYNPGGIGFNINTPVIFKSLCQSLNQGL